MTDATGAGALAAARWRRGYRDGDAVSRLPPLPSGWRLQDHTEYTSDGRRPARCVNGADKSEFVDDWPTGGLRASAQDRVTPRQALIYVNQCQLGEANDPARSAHGQ